MVAKRFFQSMLVVAILATSFVSTGDALALGGCARYVTVQWSDTLQTIAGYCGVTVFAIRKANPGLKTTVYTGQILYIPPINLSASAPVSAFAPAAAQTGNVYVVQAGDTIGNIAARMGISVNDIVVVNPQIVNINLIFPGQTINLPATVSAFVAAPPPPVSVSATATPSPVNVASTPAPTSSATQYSVLRVIRPYGLLVRAGPGSEYPVIDSEFVSAVFGTNWRYRKNSVTKDAKGFEWVEIALSPLVKTHKIGWIMVNDPAGAFFTSPSLYIR